MVSFHHRAFTFWLLFIVNLHSQQVANNQSVEVIRSDYKAKKSAIEKEYLTKPLKELNEAYEGYMKEVVKKFSEEGKLTAALKARDYLELPKRPELGKKPLEKYPEIAKLVKVYVDRSEKIKTKFNKVSSDYSRDHIILLKNLEVEHTKKQNLDFALELRNEINRISFDTYFPKEDSSNRQNLKKLKIKGLQAHYTFDGNANDQSLNRNHGEVFGASLGVDRHGNMDSAYYFDGKDDYVKVPDDRSLNFEENLSVSLWLRPRNSWEDKGVSGVICKMKARDRKTKYQNGYLIYYPYKKNGSLGAISRGTPSMEERKSNKISTRYFLQTTVSDITMDFNQWTHWVITWSGRGLKYYKNGEDAGSFSIIGKPELSSMSPLFIGVNEFYRTFNYWGSIHWNGGIDDIRIYNRALEDNEIALIYNAEK